MIIKATISEHSVNRLGQFFAAEAMGIRVVDKSPYHALCTELTAAGYGDHRLEACDEEGRPRGTVDPVSRLAGWTLIEDGEIIEALRPRRMPTKSTQKAIREFPGTSAPWSSKTECTATLSAI